MCVGGCADPFLLQHKQERLVSGRGGGRALCLSARACRAAQQSVCVLTMCCHSPAEGSLVLDFHDRSCSVFRVRGVLSCWRFEDYGCVCLVPIVRSGYMLATVAFPLFKKIGTHGGVWSTIVAIPPPTNGKGSAAASRAGPVSTGSILGLLCPVPCGRKVHRQAGIIYFGRRRRRKADAGSTGLER